MSDKPAAEEEQRQPVSSAGIPSIKPELESNIESGETGTGSSSDKQSENSIENNATSADAATPSLCQMQQSHEGADELPCSCKTESESPQYNEATPVASRASHRSQKTPTSSSCKNEPDAGSSVTTVVVGVEISEGDNSGTPSVKRTSPRLRPPRLAYTNRPSQLSSSVNAATAELEHYLSASARLQNWLAFNRRVRHETSSQGEERTASSAFDVSRADVLLPAIVEGYVFDGSVGGACDSAPATMRRPKPNGFRESNRIKALSEVDRQLSNKRTTDDLLASSRSDRDVNIGIVRQTELVKQMQSSSDLLNSRQRELIRTVDVSFGNAPRCEIARQAAKTNGSDRRLDGAFVGTRILRNCHVVDNAAAVTRGALPCEVPSSSLIMIADLVAAAMENADCTQMTTRSRKRGNSITSLSSMGSERFTPETMSLDAIYTTPAAILRQ
jgi:hypothetical protein